MLRRYHIFTLAAALFFGSTLTTQAFVLHDTSAVALSDQIALYSITYSVQFGDRDAYYPTTGILATEGLQKSVKYSVFDGETSVTPHFTTALVVSSAEKIDDEYYLAEDTTELQTLHVIIKTEPDQSVLDLAVQLTEIPVRTVSDGASLSLFRLRGGILDATLTDTPKLFGASN